MINNFFNAIINAVIKEEAELNQLFKSNANLYQKYHHGVCNLYETTFIYVIFKELLRSKFPYTIYWEYPYPNNKNEHCDLAILKENDDLEALVEFKLWINNNDTAIKSDITKLKRVDFSSRYIVVIGYGGDLNENNDYLLRNNPTLKCVDKIGLTTRFFKTIKNEIIDNELNIFLYEVS